MIINNSQKILVLILILFSNLAFGMDKNQFFIQSGEFFHLNVEDGLVKYKQIKKNDSKIHDLVNYLSNVDLNSFNSSEKLAFYINAYNLLIINKIIEKFPVESPTSIPGFFDIKKHRIAGEKLTLNDLENNKIRTYNDSRIHFVLVCAALGCPKLGNFSFTPDKLEQQLTQQTKLALNDPDFIKTDGNMVELSEIFKWYRQDFGKSNKDLILFINKYRTDQLPENTKFNYYAYDWKLNELK